MEKRYKKCQGGGLQYSDQGTPEKGRYYQQLTPIREGVCYKDT